MAGPFVTRCFEFRHRPASGQRACLFVVKILRSCAEGAATRQLCLAHRLNKRRAGTYACGAGETAG